MKWLSLIACALLTDPARAAEGVDLLLPVEGKPVRLRIEIAGEGEAAPEVRWGKFLDELFDDVDRNGDGTLTEVERKRMVPLPGVVGLPKGDLTRANFKSACRSAGFTPVVSRVVPATAEQLRASAILFEQLDRNRDGTLAKEELRRLDDLYERLDTVEDDALTRDEILGTSRPMKEVKNEAVPTGVSPLDPKAEVTATFHLTPPPDSKTPWTVGVYPEGMGGPDNFGTVRFSRPRLSVGCDLSRNDFDAQLAATREFYASPYDSALGKKPSLETSLIDADPALQGVKGMVPYADRDGDGKLTPTEVDRFLTLVVRGSRCQVTVWVFDPGPDVFDLLDTNRNGKIDRKEGSLADLQIRQNREKVRRTELSRNVTLLLEPGPIEPSFGPIRFAPTKRPILRATPKVVAGPAWFREMDRNRDGIVSLREFGGSAEKFATWDTDGDGLLSVAEAEAVR